jgi:hypothetical protein
MAKTIVDATGRMRTIEDSPEQLLQKKYDSMEEALRKAETHFTKNWLMRTYGLRTTEVWSFIRLMEARQVLAKDNPVTKVIGQRTVFSEASWHIVNRPAPGAQTRPIPPWASYGALPGFPGKTMSKGMRRRLAGQHLCDRCGSVIAGKGRHRKSSRGHTREICDLAMVKVIHES